jgi:uncharacterized RDD family membrane protein YckC
MSTPSDQAPQPPPAPVSYWEPPKEDPGPAPGVKFASHGGRLAAYIIDGLIVGAVYFVFFFIAFAVFIGGARAGDFEDGVSRGAAAAAFGLFGILFVIGIVLNLVYFPYFWLRSGQTPGMRPFGLYVVRDSDGGRISTGQAILRLIGMWVAALPLYLGFIWVFIDPRRRGWHDLIAGTVVVERTRPD